MGFERACKGAQRLGHEVSLFTQFLPRGCCGGLDGNESPHTLLSGSSGGESDSGGLLRVGHWSWKDSDISGREPVLCGGEARGMLGRGLVR